jgi:hypothetical protein
MARPKRNPRKRKSYKPKTKGAFARSLAAQINPEGTNYQLLQKLPDGTLQQPVRQTPIDFNPASFKLQPKPTSTFL